MELSLGSNPHRNSLAERITSEILWQNRSNRKSFGRTDQIGNPLAEQIKSEIRYLVKMTYTNDMCWDVNQTIKNITLIWI